MHANGEVRTKPGDIMSINRKFFYDHLHDTLFSTGLSQSQVDGHTAILDAWEEGYAKEDDRWLAYMLATAYHETARTMQPVRETLAPTDDKAIARLENAWNAGKLSWVKTPYWRKDAEGRTWLGRGLVQLTHKANYEKMKKETGVDLVSHPELAMEMDVAIKIMFIGMIKGSFTTHKLADYFSKTNEDWVHARRIINGMDRAQQIAVYAKTYYSAVSYTIAEAA
jgi:predicted chitinase